MNLEFLIPITLFASIALSIKFVVDSRVRRRLVESNGSEELVRAMLLADEESRRHGALKWGMVLTLVGVAFGLIDVVNLNPDSPATFGLLIGAAGLGMLGFHFIASKRKD